MRRFLGEGGKKRVFLAHDTQLDRDVAFSLIKTDGLGDTGRERITREAQSMGRLGSSPHMPAHNPRFIALMDGVIPEWPLLRDRLNLLLLLHDDWTSQRRGAAVGAPQTS